ncbi:heme-degrading domain-containing protein [Shinella sp. M31]|uniref:heme-degrading domain-containing protein n=1 Tax=Shinella sp. M31 TaxID=3368615 RepID=UPI003BA374E4
MTDMIADDIRRLEEQERLLRFTRFSPDDAWALGNRVRETALALGAGVAIDISLRDRVLFHCALPGTSTDNVEWIRRKRNTVLRLWHSSYLVGRRLALSGREQVEAHNLPHSDFAVHGGSFPLFVAELGCVGAVTVSGVPQRTDHAIVADAIAAFLGIDLGDNRLPD